MIQNLSDDELMDMIRAGQSKAFQVLFDRHSSAVLGYCLRTLAGNRAMADDIHQEVWFKVVKKADLYQNRGHFKAWLMTIARNETISQIRGQLILHKDDALAEANTPSGEDIEQNLLDKHDAEYLQAAIDALPAIQRTVLVMWLSDELSYDQIAEALEMTEPAVRTYLFRAKRTLKEKLGGK